MHHDMTKSHEERSYKRIGRERYVQFRKNGPWIRMKILKPRKRKTHEDPTPPTPPTHPTPPTPPDGEVSSEQQPRTRFVYTVDASSETPEQRTARHQALK